MRTIQSCRNCRTVLLPGQQSCLRCGAPAEAEFRDCPACHRPAAADAGFCSACGSAMAAPPVLAPPVSSPGPAPFVAVRQPRRRTYLIAGAALSVIVLLVAGVSAVRAVFYDPADVVEDYFAALADRDIDAVNALVEVPKSEDPDQSLELRPLPLGEPYQPPSDVQVVSVEEVEESGEVPDEGGENAADWREATVAYKVGGTDRRATFYLHRQQEKELGLFRDWRIAGAISAINVQVPGGSPDVLVNGQTVAAADGYASAVAYPGLYEVRMADNPLVEASPQTVEAGPFEAEPVVLNPSVTRSATEEVDKQVRAFVDTCAKSTELSPPGCPFSEYSFGTVTGVSWKVDSYPVLALTLSDGAVSVRSVEDGQVTVSYRSLANPYTNQRSFWVRGTAAVVGGSIVFQPEN